MGLQDILRSAMKTVDQVTKDLQEEVTLYRWNGQDDTGSPTFAPALEIKSIVNHSGKRIRTTAGEEVLSTAWLTIVKPIPELSPEVDGREEPIDKRDKFVLANGQTGPILKTDGGLADPMTLDGYVLQVWLG
jgi:hypothetical protein